MKISKTKGALTVISISVLLTLLACQLTNVLEGITSPPQTTPTPAYEVRTATYPLDGATLVYIPEGIFLMGQQDAVNPDLNQVHLDAFWIYQVPVTMAQFAVFVAQTGHITTAEIAMVSEGWCYDYLCFEIPEVSFAAPFGWESDPLFDVDHPAVHISWFDAAAYCEWAGGRLPSEAQWEKAARGMDGRTYPWGSDAITGDKANFCDLNCKGLMPHESVDAEVDDGYTYTSPVGHYPAGASPFGVLDMAGNVWEWVHDYYDYNYYRNLPAENPVGPSSGTNRVLRGGSFTSITTQIQTSYRKGLPPEHTDIHTGFRCVHIEPPTGIE